MTVLTDANEVSLFPLLSHKSPKFTENATFSLFQQSTAGAILFNVS